MTTLKRIKVIDGSHKIWFGFNTHTSGGQSRTVGGLLPHIMTALGTIRDTRNTPTGEDDDNDADGADDDDPDANTDDGDDEVSVWMDGFMLPKTASVDMIRDNDTLSIIRTHHLHHQHLHHDHDHPSSTLHRGKRKGRGISDATTMVKRMKKTKEKEDQKENQQEEVDDREEEVTPKKKEKKEKKEKKKKKRAIDDQHSNDNGNGNGNGAITESMTTKKSKKKARTKPESIHETKCENSPGSESNTDEGSPKVTGTRSPSPATILSSTARHVRFGESNDSLRPGPPFNGLVLPLPSQMRALHSGGEGAFTPSPQWTTTAPPQARSPRGKRRRRSQRSRHSGESTEVDPAADHDLSAASEQQNAENATSQPPTPLDYTALAPLSRPLTVNDVIAFKVMELSASYTPEISEFREAAVIAVDPVAKTVRLRLAEGSRERTKGDWDGLTPRKFELDDPVDGAEGLLDTEVDFAVPDLLDVRIIKCAEG